MSSENVKEEMKWSGSKYSVHVFQAVGWEERTEFESSPFFQIIRSCSFQSKFYPHSSSAERPESTSMLLTVEETQDEMHACLTSNVSADSVKCFVSSTVEQVLS